MIPSGGPVRAVLEVIAGTARKLGIEPGDHVAGAILRALTADSVSFDARRRRLLERNETVYPKAAPGGV